MTRDELNTRVDAELLTGATNKEVAEKYDIPYITVSLRAKKLNELEVPTELTDSNLTRATLELIRDKIAMEAPKVAARADLIIDGLDGIKILNKEIQDGLSKVVKLAVDMLDSEELDKAGNVVPMSKRDLQILAAILTSVYSALNAKGTTVNVATSVTTESQNLAFFKSSVRDV
jgi:hypothetical protein